MISRLLNPNKCLTKVDLYAKELDKIKPINDVDELISALGKYATSSQVVKLKAHLPSQIHHKATLTSKRLLKKYLSIIAAVLNDQVSGVRLSISAKKSVLSKLTEGIGDCGPGYLNRVYIVMGSLNQYESVDALLCAYRLQLVEKAYNGANSDDIHLYHRFHVVANSSGYGIPYKEVRDPYTGDLSDSQIEERIKAVFDFDYTPSDIMAHFWEQAPIYQLGYVGRINEELGYDIGTCNGILELIRKVFQNQNLSMADCFIIDDQNSAVRDINWLNINSMLYRYLLDNRYLNLNDYQAQIACHHHKSSLSLTYPHDDIKNAVINYVGENGESYTGFFLAVKKELFALVSDGLLANLMNRVERQYRNASLDQLKELYGLGLISFDFLFPRLVAQARTVESFLLCSKGLSEEESRLLLDAVHSDFNYKISSVKDAVNFIKAVSLDTLVLLIEDERFRLDVNNVLVEDDPVFSCTDFLSALPKEKAGLIFDIISNWLFSNELRNADFRRLIRVLPADKIATACALEMEKYYSTEYDFSTIEFKKTLRYLDKSQKVAVYDAYKEILLKNIKTWRHLSNVFTYLPEEQCRYVLNHLGGRLTSIIKDSSAFHQFSRDVSQDKVRMVMDGLGNHLHHMIRGVNSFVSVVGHLNKQNIARLFENVALYDKLSSHIKSYEDARNVFCKLSTPQRSVLFRNLKPILAELAGDYHFCDFSNLLTPKQCELFYTLQAEKLTVKADTKRTLLRCCELLKPKQLGLFLMKLKEQHHPLLQDNDIIKKVVEKLSRKQVASLSRRLTGLNSDERKIVANSFRHIYQAYLASLTGPRIFKPHHALLSGIDDYLSNDALLSRIALGISNKPGSLVDKIWQYALLHANDYQHDPALQRSIAAWSMGHSSLFHRSRYSNEAQNDEVPAQVSNALRA